MKTKTVPELPPHHLRTLEWMFNYSKEYLTKHQTGRPAERAMAQADVDSFQEWLRQNWPQKP